MSMLRDSKIKSFFSLFRISFSRVKNWSFIVVMMGVLLGISWGANTIFTQRLFDVAEGVLQGNIGLTVLFQTLVLLGIVNLVNQIVNCMGNISHRIYQSKIYGIFCEIMQAKIEDLPLIAYDDVNKLNQIEKAQKGLETIAPTMLIMLLFVGFYFPYCLLMFFYLASLSPYLVVILPLAFFPTLLVQILRTRSVKKFEDVQAPLRRERRAYKSYLTEREYFKETRLKGGEAYFIMKHQQVLSKSLNLERKMESRCAFRELYFKGITAIGYIGSIVVLLMLTIKGNITVGSFAAVFASMNSLFSLMEEIVFYNIAQIQSNLGTIWNYLKFVGEESSVEMEGNYRIGKIEAQRISFVYPDAENEAIHDLSLSISPGETIALVGENGSGKSTLIKLLIGQYTPTEGNILYDERPIKQNMEQQLGDGISGVFQQYQKYRFTLAENVYISQTNKGINIAQIDEVLEGVGFNKTEAKVNLNSILSCEFGGSDLSGGEWQKVAMARGIYRDHEFIVLDEPVSAIDPLIEAEIYKLFATIAEEKTVIIVTHRLSSVQFADRIIVLKEGCIVEEGSHRELLDKNGIYTEMYEAQREWYKLEKGKGV